MISFRSNRFNNSCSCDSNLVPALASCRVGREGFLTTARYERRSYVFGVRRLLGVVAALSVHLFVAGEGWESHQLHDEFFAEGASFGDIDGDGSGDLVSGPYWWKGPSFKQRFEIYEPKAFGVRTYSDNFFSHVHDVDGDGDQDVFVFGFPGKEGRLYLNSGHPEKNKHWKMSVVADQISHESPSFVDIVPGGLPEIVCSRGRAFGYYEAGDRPSRPWIWNAVSEVGETVMKFGHGLGTGDLDGDGDLDVIDRFSWWENPGRATKSPWAKHVWVEEKYERGGAQVHVHDIDGDGMNDIVTSLNGHGYGLAWFRQIDAKAGELQFERHDIMGTASVQNPYGVAFSQLHGVALRDIDGDGLKDIVTGKRWYAHNGKDVGGNQEAVLYWFQCVRENGKTSFVPRMIDNNSGVGVDVLVADLNGDSRLDVVSSNKKGVTLHFQGQAVASVSPERWQVPGGQPDTDWSDSSGAKAAARQMTVPDGFHVDLIASEPDLVQPIAMSFDARGRIWVIEANTYPQRVPGKKGKDRILILEDTNGDGDFDTRKIFVDGLNLVSGIEIGFGGVWIGAAPNLLFFADADGDDKPDGEPEVLLDGWGYEDTHETLNSFTWGPDGWLYGCHGVFTHSRVGKPGTPDDLREPLNAGIWRYHPTRHEFEVFAHGISNPWGLDFDENGDWFSSACVIPHYYHVIQGARYFRQAGEHFNPYVYDDIETIADHLHYGDGTLASMKADGKVDRALQIELAADTSAVGGGHAHCGLVVYQGDTFPESYRGDHFFFNLHGHRIVRERTERDGSGHVARHGPDFALAKDHAFVGVGLMLGPDGALYASDWHDPQTCHHRDYEIWDRTDGRIFRVRYGDHKARPIDLPSESDLDLVEALRHENAFIARQAQRLLQERAAVGSMDTNRVARALKALTASNQDRVVRLRAMWTQQVCGLLGSDALYSYLSDGDSFVRGWAIHFLAEDESKLDTETLNALIALAERDPSADVRRYLSAGLQRLPLSQRWSLAEALAARPEDIKDNNLPLMVWYGIEPLVEENPNRAIRIASRTVSPLVGDFVRRRAAAFEEGRNSLLAYVANTNSADDFSKRGAQYLAAIGTQTNLERSKSWDAFLEKGEQLNGRNAKAMLARIRARLGDSEAFPYWRTVVADLERLPRLRSEALELLQLGGDSEVGPLAASLLTDSGLRQAALSALPRYLDESIAEQVIDALPSFPLTLRNEGINLLASRPETTQALLESIESGELNASLVSPVLMRQMRNHGVAKVDALMDSIWGAVNPSPPNLPRQVRRWKFALTPERLDRVDLSYGRHVFENTCGTCHKLFDEGVAMGPDLTGSNRANLDYLLENVLAPNSLIGNAYQLNVITTKDGRTISGMVRKENDTSLTVAMAGGSEVILRKEEIANRQVLEQSMMPTGLFDAIPETDVAALVAYLASPAQVEKWKEEGE